MKLYYVITNIVRHKLKSVLTIFVGLILTLLLSIYFGNLYSYQQQLNDLAENTNIYCQVVNLDGSRKNGLDISEALVDSLQNSDFLKEPAFTLGMTAGIGEFEKEDWGIHVNTNILGANTLEAVDGMESEAIRYMEGWEEKFFYTEEYVCIASEEWMEKNKYHVGDEVELNLYYYVYDDVMYSTELNQLGLETVRIVGTMKEIASAESVGLTDLIVPLPAVRQIFREKETQFYCDSASFYVRNPLELNEFKQEMERIGLLPCSLGTTISFKGTALVMNDNIFISLASNILQSLHLLWMFFPVIFVAILFVGYIVSYLLCNGRQKEIALLRILGIRKIGIVSMFWLEQLVNLMTGILAGDLFTVLMMGNVQIILPLNLVILLSYLLGAITALGRLGKLSVVQLLSLE